MIRINLIPKKVSKKKMGLMQHIALAGLAFLLVAGGIGYSWMSLNTKISTLNRQVAEAKAEKEKLKNVNAERTKYEKSITKLKGQLDIIVQIKAGRFVPIRLFDELTKVLDAQTPIWLSRFSYNAGGGKSGGIKMDGYSLSNPDLAAFVTKMEKTPFYKSLNLIISQKSKSKGTKEEAGREFYKFSLTASPQMEDDPVAKKVTE
jgi:type IV pilus assembly protein PilN